MIFFILLATSMLTTLFQMLKLMFHKQVSDVTLGKLTAYSTSAHNELTKIT